MSKHEWKSFKYFCFANDTVTTAWHTNGFLNVYNSKLIQTKLITKVRLTSATSSKSIWSSTCSRCANLIWKLTVREFELYTYFFQQQRCHKFELNGSNWSGFTERGTSHHLQFPTYQLFSVLKYLPFISLVVKFCKKSLDLVCNKQL